MSDLDKIKNQISDILSAHNKTCEIKVIVVNARLQHENVYAGNPSHYWDIELETVSF